MPWFFTGHGVCGFTSHCLSWWSVTGSHISDMEGTGEISDTDSGIILHSGKVYFCYRVFKVFFCVCNLYVTWRDSYFLGRNPFLFVVGLDKILFAYTALQQKNVKQYENIKLKKLWNFSNTETEFRSKKEFYNFKQVGKLQIVSASTKN